MPAAAPVPSLALAVVGLVVFGLLAAMATAWAWAIGRLVTGKPLLPSRGPRAVPWGVGSLLAVVLLYFALNFAVMIGYVAVSRLAGAGPGALRMSPRTTLALMALCNLALLPMVPLTLRLTSGAKLADFGLVRGSVLADALLGVGACLLLAPPVYALMAAATKVWMPRRHPMEEMIKANPTGTIALLAFASGVVLAPAAEELIFRGVLQGWLVRACTRRPRKPRADPFAEEIDLRVLDVEADAGPFATGEFAPSASPWSAPAATLDPPSRPSGSLLVGILPGVVTSLLFAALHWPQWPAPIPLFVLSLALGALYQRTGGLVAPFVLHATFNGLSTLMMYLAILAAPAGKPPAPPVEPPATAVPGLARPLLGISGEIGRVIDESGESGQWLPLPGEDVVGS